MPLFLFHFTYQTRTPIFSTDATEIRASFFQRADFASLVVCCVACHIAGREPSSTTEKFISSRILSVEVLIAVVSDRVECIPYPRDNPTVCGRIRRFTQALLEANQNENKPVKMSKADEYVGDFDGWYTVTVQHEVSNSIVVLPPNTSLWLRWVSEALSRLLTLSDSRNSSKWISSSYSLGWGSPVHCLLVEVLAQKRDNEGECPVIQGVDWYSVVSLGDKAKPYFQTNYGRRMKRTDAYSLASLAWWCSGNEDVWPHPKGMNRAVRHRPAVG